MVDVVNNGGGVERLLLLLLQRRRRCGVARDVLLIRGGSRCRLVAALAGRLGGVLIVVGRVA